MLKLNTGTPRSLQIVTCARTAVGILVLVVGGFPLKLTESSRPPLSTVNIVFLPFGLLGSTSKYGTSSVAPAVSLTAGNGSGVIGVVTICARAGHDPTRSTAVVHSVVAHCVFFFGCGFI